MAVGEYSFPELGKISGIRLGSACAGINQTERDDLVVVQLESGSICSAVFTQNAFCAAPITIAREHLSNSPEWLLINSGNANAGTGKLGFQNAERTCNALAKLVNGHPHQVLPFSTGVIGEQLPVEKIEMALPVAIAALSESGWDKAARAIMTTDTRLKGASRTIGIGKHKVSISGIAKGAGMIHPNMATMLAFIGTDAAIKRPLLQTCLQEVMEESFNSITVDGDTSTNDACVLIASGKSGASAFQSSTSFYIQFLNALQDVCNELAEAIVRDGEGATKLIRIKVDSAADKQEASMVAKTIAHSPLVKTAFFAGDPNWGRILAAIGRSGLKDFDISNVSVWLDDVCIIQDGGPAPAYTEESGKTVMMRDEIVVRVDLRRGDASARVLSCDLSYDYVRINAEYRT